MIELLQDFLVVRLKHDEVKQSLIIMPEEKLSINKGEVVLISPNCEHVKKGNIVYFSHTTGQGFIHEGEELLAMHEDELLGFEGE